MSTFQSQNLMSDIAHVLGRIRSKGVTLWSENGELRYRAPKGVLTNDELQRLRSSREEIVALLGGRSACRVGAAALQGTGRRSLAPLAFSQLQHWNSARLWERPSSRPIAAAVRLAGALDVLLLQNCTAAMVERHEALRTQIVTIGGEPTQSVAESGWCELRIADVSAYSEYGRSGAVAGLIDQLILEPVDVTTDPLLAIVLIKLREDEHVLIAAMEHSISDALSMNIFLRDLFTTYAARSSGVPVTLPPISIQLADYASWQRNAIRAWTDRHGLYWKERLHGYGRLNYPTDGAAPGADRKGWGTLPVRIGKRLKQELHEWCRVRHTTLVMGVLTVYVALLLRWCRVSEAVIRYQVGGRARPEVENTIGYFASVLYLRIELLDGDTFIDLMQRLTAEYCRAYEHCDFSYLEAQLPLPDFARNGRFNWVPQEPTSALGALPGTDVLRSSPVPFSNPALRKSEWDGDPSILLYDRGDEITGDVLYPLWRFSSPIMERFAQNFLICLKELLTDPPQRVQEIDLR